MLNLALIGIDDNTKKVLAAARADGRFHVAAAYADTFECSVEFSLHHDIDTIYMETKALLNRTDIDVVYVSAEVPHAKSVVKQALRAGKTVLVPDRLELGLQHGDLIKLPTSDGESFDAKLAVVATALSEPILSPFDETLVC
ncbi:hypothetical protein [Lacticaseibacillus hulanensis]|uniref:hypothetical protein n=1 Tax=Lacticaseibacillus hulanensis TaxID=2493111 RepID=UPI000FDC8EBC|nr:hypothetical protein [Lacticaseibacillus hulanensis]